MYIARGGALGKQEEGDISPSEADDGVGKATPVSLSSFLRPSLLLPPTPSYSLPPSPPPPHRLLSFFHLANIYWVSPMCLALC